MKALTIQQPYASLIALPDSDPRCKRVENRSWPTAYRGLLLIHAGKGRDYLQPKDLEDFPLMPFGAIIATADLCACVRLEDIDKLVRCHAELAWLLNHPYVEGPWCWLLQNVLTLSEPVGCRGDQGLWTPGTSLQEQVVRALTKGARKELELGVRSQEPGGKRCDAT